MKVFKKHLSLMLAIIMLTATVLSSIKVQAATISTSDTKNSYVVNLTNDSYLTLTIKEDGTTRTAEYFENGIRSQIATYDDETREILYYDLSSNNTSEKSPTKKARIATSAESIQTITPVKYRLEDFIVEGTMDKDINMRSVSTYATRATSSFNYLKSKTLRDSSGTAYLHYLYGYQDTKQYEEMSWHFAAGTAITVISTALGAVLPVAKVITTIIGVTSAVGGIILSAITASSWIKEHFWVYKFKRTYPSYVEAVCFSRPEFTYKKERKVELNGDEGYWEVIEEQANWEIENIRDNILSYPGNYI